MLTGYRSWASAARRFPALAVVLAAHALALAWFLALTARRPVRLGADAAPTLVVLLPHVEPGERVPRTARPRPPREVAPASEAIAPSASPTPQREPSHKIVWAAEAKDAATRLLAREAEARRSAHAFGAPPASAMFTPAPRRKPAFKWNYARTHRVEALPQGVSVFNLNDHCAIAVLWVVPFFGCQLGKIPIRGDLFEHMRDAPEPGDWNN